MRKSFILYMDLARSVRKLEDAAAGRLIKAVYGYIESGVLPDNLDGAEAVCFDVIQNALDRDAEKYEQTRQRRIEASRRGGQKAQEQMRQYAAALQVVKVPLESTQVNQVVNGNGNVNVNGNVNGNENENENENVNANVNENGNGNQNVNAAPEGGRIEAPSPKIYGRYQNLSFTEEEYVALQKEFPKDYEARLERLSEYTASTGKHYASALATIRSWARKEQEEAHEKSERDAYTDYGSTLGIVL